MATIRDAVEALNRRKEAARSDPDATFADRDVAARMLVGLDLDREELRMVQGVVVATAVGDMGIAHPIDLIAGTWADGLLTGLMLADLRAREEARAKA